MIEIKKLDDMAQASFQSCKSLNHIQSRIYRTTYQEYARDLSRSCHTWPSILIPVCTVGNIVMGDDLQTQAACGLNNKPKIEIVSIDAEMDSQPEINEKMQAILIDWLVQVHGKFELSPETLYCIFRLFIDAIVSINY
ncbi:hypothetical protein CASFOL_011570 [Castilleja foliolosa]|uniref:Cyclin N-terminal domain-containing protein n=1 Tax=Castilleja foliolosa TaxID=1961234 RepID=A0ABD3DZU3_9LAMI